MLFSKNTEKRVFTFNLFYINLKINYYTYIKNNSYLHFNITLIYNKELKIFITFLEVILYLPLLSPLCVIVCIFFFRNVFLSLILGLLSGAIIFNLSHLQDIPLYLAYKFRDIFYSNSQIHWDKLYIMGFLLFLGVFGEIITRNGGVEAFGIWIKKHIKKAKSAELALFGTGLILFIDGCFNAVVLGAIAKPLHKIYSISKKRLAYIVDSTSSPVCVIVPFSSWGAYIVGILQSNLEKGENAFLIFLQSIAFNFYAWLTLICVLAIILFSKNTPNSTSHISSNTPSSPLLLIVPFFSLLLCILALMVYDGFRKTHTLSVMHILGSADIGRALFQGGGIALILSSLISLPSLSISGLLSAIKVGIKNMLPVIAILLLAWVLGPVLKQDLQIASLLSSLFFENFSLQYSFLLPAFLFLLSMLISFSTGTSWGCFAIMLPIGIDLSLQSGGNIALAIASVLSGSVYGDHTSAISDTTILSASSTGCSLDAHFKNQIFYAGLCAIASLGAFLSFSWNSSLILSYIIGLLLLLPILFLRRKRMA